MNAIKTITYPQVQAIESTVNMQKQDVTNKHHRIQGGTMFIGGLIFAAVITAYVYNGHTNIFTFIGVGITLAGLMRLPANNECPVNGWSKALDSDEVSHLRRNDYWDYYSPNAPINRIKT